MEMELFVFCVMFATTKCKYSVDLGFKQIFKEIDASTGILLLKKTL